MFRRHDHRDGFPFTIMLALMAGIALVTFGYSRPAAAVAAMVAFAAAGIRFAVWVTGQIRHAARQCEELRIDLDSVTTLVTYSRAHRGRAGQPADTPRPVLLEDRRRWRRWRRSVEIVREHPGATGSGTLAVGVVLGALVLAALHSPPRAEQPVGAAPLDPTSPAGLPGERPRSAGPTSLPSTTTTTARPAARTVIAVPKRSNRPAPSTVTSWSTHPVASASGTSSPPPLVRLAVPLIKSLNTEP